MGINDLFYPTINAIAQIREPATIILLFGGSAVSLFYIIREIKILAKGLIHRKNSGKIVFAIGKIIVISLISTVFYILITSLLQILTYKA